MACSFALFKSQKYNLKQKGVAASGDYLRYVTDGAIQARQLISDVLNYARVDHETEKLDNIDSEKTLSGVLRDLSAIIEETDAQITHDPLPQVYVQSTHLRQLLENLIGNALKFCSGKPEVHIGAKQEGMMWRFDPGSLSRCKNSKPCACDA